MTSPPKKVLSGDYKVGYGRPPTATRFRKGVCGNPGGRPRGMTAGRANRLALQEAYRPITMREGDKVRTLPTIQAVMRSQAWSAAQGNGPAQRHFIDRVHAIEQEEAMQATKAAETAQDSSITDEERMQVVAEFLASKGDKPVPIAQDRTENSDLRTLKDPPKGTAGGR